MKFAYEVPNWAMQCQTKACITESSCLNKRENIAWLKVTDTIFFFGTLCIV